MFGARGAPSTTKTGLGHGGLNFHTSFAQQSLAIHTLPIQNAIPANFDNEMRLLFSPAFDEYGQKLGLDDNLLLLSFNLARPFQCLDCSSKCRKLVWGFRRTLSDDIYCFVIDAVLFSSKASLRAALMSCAYAGVTLTFSL